MSMRYSPFTVSIVKQVLSVQVTFSARDERKKNIEGTNADTLHN